MQSGNDCIDTRRRFPALGGAQGVKLGPAEDRQRDRT